MSKITLTSPVTENQIRRFYLQGFQKEEYLRDWPHLWRKHYRLRFDDRRFLKLNNLRPRLNFRSLIRYCIHFAPRHVYMSVLDYLMPERVGSKDKLNRAYPVGGEFVVDVDAYLFWRPHSHYDWGNGVCIGCISLAKDVTERLIRSLRTTVT